jgi:O-methyltransferase
VEKGVVDIERDILEVGVWRGGTGVTLAAAAQKCKPGSKVHLCDTFSGVAKAGSLDSRYQVGEHEDISVEHVKSLLAGMKLGNFEIHQGIVPEHAPASLADKKSALDIVN